MKKALCTMLLALVWAPMAQAAPHRLAPGVWQIQDGLEFATNGKSGSKREFCIQPGKTIVTPDWFAELAKPKDDCQASLSLESDQEMMFDIACVSNGLPLAGPSHIRFTDNAFSIESDLEMDLGGTPFPMHRALSAKRVRSQCPP